MIVGTFQPVGHLDRVRGHRDWLKANWCCMQVIQVTDAYVDPSCASQGYAVEIATPPDLAGMQATAGDWGIGTARAVMEADKERPNQNRGSGSQRRHAPVHPGRDYCGFSRQEDIYRGLPRDAASLAPASRTALARLPLPSGLDPSAGGEHRYGDSIHHQGQDGLPLPREVELECSRGLYFPRPASSIIKQCAWGGMLWSGKSLS